MKAMIFALGLFSVLNVSAQVLIEENFDSPSSIELTDVSIVNIANSYDGSPCAVASNANYGTPQEIKIKFEPFVIPEDFEGFDVSFVAQMEVDNIPPLGGLPIAEVVVSFSTTEDTSDAITGQNDESLHFGLYSNNEWVEFNDVADDEFYNNEVGSYNVNVGDTIYTNVFLSYTIWGVLSVDNFVVSNLYTIGTNELLILLNNFGYAVEENQPCYLDSNNNGVTEIEDLLNFMLHWGTNYNCSL